MQKFVIAIIFLTAAAVMQAQTTRTVCSSECDHTTINAAIDASCLGDTIVVTAGQTFTENVGLDYKSCGSGWITIQSSALASLPAEGNRVSPSDAANMPTLRSTSVSDAVIKTQSGSTPSHHYKLIGLNIERQDVSGYHYGLVLLGETGSSQNTFEEEPHHFVIDRCLIRGLDGRNTRRGIALNAKNVEITNSYIDKFFEAGADTQAIVGWNGSGEWLIRNNFLEAAGENMMIGGADPDISNLVPTNIVIEYNHFFKPLAWKGSEPGPVKNLFELKNAKNVVAQYNIFENHWSHAQSGYAIVFTVRNQSGSASWSTVEDVTFRYNIVKNTERVFNITNTDNNYTSQVTKNIYIENNLFFSTEWPYMLARGGAGISDKIQFTHNTFIGSTGASKYLWYESSSQFLSDHKFNDNIVAVTSGAFSGIAKSDGPYGTGTLDIAAPGEWEFNNNVLQTSSSGNPPASFYPANLAAIGFEDTDNGIFKLSSGSNYKNDATDGSDPGVNWDALMAYTECVEEGDCGDSPTPTPTPTPSPTPTPEGPTLRYYGNEAPPVDSESWFGWVMSYLGF
ncbi:MAG: hypothetical protein KF855_03530 [Acidobacteria bacterium]|nr:hypothetical protein [Acidobacteriota bacterium]